MSECYVCLCIAPLYCRGLCKTHYDSERYYNNIEYIKEKSRKYYIKNKSKINKYNDEWRKTNPEKVLNHLKKYLETNGDIFNMSPNQYMYAINSWSKTIKKLDNYMCKNCSSKENLHAHHIQPREHFPELSLNVDNGITLCKECHEDIHGFKTY